MHKNIDYHYIKYWKEAVQCFLEDDLYRYKIQIPNFLIDNGRRLYYVLLIEQVLSMTMPILYAVQRERYIIS
ncbi:hypothetical protein [Clostridium sp. CCUG 7971]|uniref:hypothetical protein n=1 Tax=Clostridium sp. CCUG 7971 TaxID=2811414 RepID=UPI001ABB1690|nr:hypothetical protein [Clostridium sp. CCUG 7971]MBO3444095.1 hypothetical protein [Clostridium sp. CCUG 7971]